LTALNRDYIHSVQIGDVQRFGEILAEDFLCSNPDGSLVDKKQFLAQTARHVTISGLSVEDVRSHSRRCRDNSRAHQLHHFRRRPAEWPLYRCLVASGRKVARGIRARDATAVF
jgi:hypothetical protein